MQMNEKQDRKSETQTPTEMRKKKTARNKRGGQKNLKERGKKYIVTKTVSRKNERRDGGPQKTTSRKQGGKINNLLLAIGNLGEI